MKENDGRGARKQLIKRLSVVFGLFGCLLLGAFFFGGGGNGGGGRAGQHGASSSRRHQDLKRSLQLKQPRHHLHHNNNNWDPDADLLDDIVQARVHLIDLVIDHDELLPSIGLAGGRSSDSSSKSNGNGNGDNIFNNNNDPSNYSGIYGKFCMLNWSLHKSDPSSTPMFRDLVGKSPDCKEPRTISLNKAMTAAQSFDESHDYSPEGQQVPKVLNLTSMVFHESRCGSTLVANLCVAANPQGHRVYSESAPPIMALKQVCGEYYDKCGIDVSAQILNDVVYLMSRSNDPLEQRVFFKIQSIGTRNLQAFEMAFPNTPWMFIYRNPVQVMMSHLSQGGNIKNANCVRGRRYRNPLIEEILRRQHIADVGDLSHEQYCAAHLATITETAVEAIDAGQNNMAIPVNYDALPDVLYETVFPNILGVRIGESELRTIQQTAMQYSKGRGNKAGQEFTGDSHRKEKHASSEIRNAADQFLQDSYEQLEQDSKTVFDKAKIAAIE